MARTPMQPKRWRVGLTLLAAFAGGYLLALPAGDRAALFSPLVGGPAARTGPTGGNGEGAFDGVLAAVQLGRTEPTAAGGSDDGQPPGSSHPPTSPTPGSDATAPQPSSAHPARPLLPPPEEAIASAHLFARPGKGPRADLAEAMLQENATEVAKSAPAPSSGPQGQGAASATARGDFGAIAPDPAAGRLALLSPPPVPATDTPPPNVVDGIVPPRDDQRAGGSPSAAMFIAAAAFEDTYENWGPRLSLTPGARGARGAEGRPANAGLDVARARVNAEGVPRFFGGLTEEEFRRRERRCLAVALYHEARGEPERGQLAVAQTVMNRVRSFFYPDTICGVIYQGAHRRGSCQFSFACDGISDLPRNQRAWEKSKRLAAAVTNGKVWLPEIGHATHYHATYVSPPWRKEMRRITRIGVHIFYKADFSKRKASITSDAPVDRSK